MAIEQFIVTDRSKGGGVNPQGAGYQLVAISSGLNTNLCEDLMPMITAFGDAVKSEAPDEVLSEFKQWRNDISEMQPVPKAILERYPPIWSYAQVGSDLFALMRVCYAGLTQNKVKFGNFLAHIYVFDPIALAPVAYNPMALAHSGLFWTEDDGNTTTLDSLDSFPKLTVEKGKECLFSPPYESQTSKMLSVLCHYQQTNQPLLLCLNSFDDQVALLEALLELLPPSTRCRTPFSTSAAKYSLTGTNLAQGPNESQAQIQVVCGKNIRTLNLTPADYRTDARRAVFNFPDAQFPEAVPDCTYADFAKHAIDRATPHLLDKHHQMIEDLDLGLERKAWSDLVPLVKCKGAETDIEYLKDGLPEILPSLTRPEQAVYVLDVTTPSLSKLAEKNRVDDLTSLGGLECINKIVALAQGAAGKQIQKFLDDIVKVAVNAFKQGYARTTLELIHICGDSVTPYIVHNVMKRIFAGQRMETVETADIVGKSGAPEAVKTPGTESLAQKIRKEEFTATIHLLSKGLVYINQEKKLPDWVGQMVVTLFVLAQRSGQVLEVWNKVGDSLVYPFFSQTLNTTRQRDLAALIQLLPKKDKSKTYTDLSLILLKAQGLDKDGLSRQLGGITQALAYCHVNVRENAITRLCELANQKAEQQAEQSAEMRTAVLACMYRTTTDETVKEMIFQRYSADLDKPAVKARVFQVRSHLAKAGYVEILCCELFTNLRLWRKNISDQKLKRWNNEILKKYPALMETICREMERRLERPGSINKLHLFCKQLLPMAKPVSDSGWRCLYKATLLNLPLKHLADPKQKQLVEDAPLQDQDVKVKVRAVQVMRKIQNLATDKRTYSILELHKANVDLNCVKALPKAQQIEMLNCIIATLEWSGITSPEHAIALYETLTDLGQPKAMVDVLGRMLKDRDKVTKVQVAMAMAEPLLHGSKQLPGWRSIFLSLMESESLKDARKLFKEHLDGCFCVREEHFEQRKAKLLQDAGLVSWFRKQPPEPTEPTQYDTESDDLGEEQLTVTEKPKKRGFLRGWRKGKE